MNVYRRNHFASCENKDNAMAYTVGRPKLTFAERRIARRSDGAWNYHQSLREYSFRQKESHYAVPKGKMGQTVTASLPRCADPCEG